MILLSDGYLANGAEPWLLPDVEHAARHLGPVRRPSPTTCDDDGTEVFWPYLRDPETLARPWAVPGTPGLHAPHRRHREGRRHRATSPTTPANHERMVAPAGRQDRRHRQATSRGRGRRRRRRRPARARLGLARGAPSTPPSTGCGAGGKKVAQAHLVHLNPFPANLGDVLRRYRQGARARDEPRASCAAWCGPSSWSTPAR